MIEFKISKDSKVFSIKQIQNIKTIITIFVMYINSQRKFIQFDNIFNSETKTINIFL